MLLRQLRCAAIFSMLLPLRLFSLLYYALRCIIAIFDALRLLIFSDAADTSPSRHATRLLLRHFSYAYILAARHLMPYVNAIARRHFRYTRSRYDAADSA